MDPWEHIRRAAGDDRSGSTAIATRAARGFEGLAARADVVRAARMLLKAHHPMGALWRLAAAAYDADDRPAAAAAFRSGLEASTDAAADGIRWATGRRHVTVVTCSASGAVERALERIAARVAGVRCLVSLPGGEGRRLATRLKRAGFTAEAVPDAAAARACLDADLVLVGADAVTGDGVINKVGTAPLALGAAAAGIGCYAIAPTIKFVPASLMRPHPSFESTPLALFDAILTERGPRRAAGVRRAVGAVTIPRPIARLAG